MPHCAGCEREDQIEFVKGRWWCNVCYVKHVTTEKIRNEIIRQQRKSAEAKKRGEVTFEE